MAWDFWQSTEEGLHKLKTEFSTDRNVSGHSGGNQSFTFVFLHKTQIKVIKSLKGISRRVGKFSKYIL